MLNGDILGGQELGELVFCGGKNGAFLGVLDFHMCKLPQPWPSARKISRGFPHLFKKCLPAHPQVKYEREGYDVYDFFPKPWVEDLPGEEFRVFKHPDFPGIPLFSVSNQGRAVTHNIKAGGRSCIGVKFSKDKNEKRKVIKSIGDVFDINTIHTINLTSLIMNQTII